jgi:RNA 2',3'-cyclic 3'-phosphodiesterase
MIRSFLAIELPKSFRLECERIITALKKTGADVKWVRPDNIHLTVKFLGNISEDAVPRLAHDVGQAVGRYAPITLRLQKTGVFPNPNKPRVIWLGLDGHIERLTRFKTDVEQAASLSGFEPERRPFQPHLTLGRMRSGHNRPELLDALTKLNPVALEFTAPEIVLVKSDLKPTGAVYTTLQRLPLGEPNLPSERVEDQKTW